MVGSEGQGQLSEYRAIRPALVYTAGDRPELRPDGRDHTRAFADGGATLQWICGVRRGIPRAGDLPARMRLDVRDTPFADDTLRVQLGVTGRASHQSFASRDRDGVARVS